MNPPSPTLQTEEELANLNHDLAMRRRLQSARLINVIEVIHLEGEDKGQVSLYRNVTSYYDIEGYPLAINDPYKEPCASCAAHDSGPVDRVVHHYTCANKNCKYEFCSYSSDQTGECPKCLRKQTREPSILRKH